MLNNYDASLDVTQEVFIKVYNSLERYSSDYKFSTWLYRIAHNAAIDYMRRNSVNTAKSRNGKRRRLVSTANRKRQPTPEQQRERSEWRNEIESVVKCLPVAYRELILLRHTQDLSYDEIAEITGLPLGTVKIVFSGRAK
jgi:RNA polymerase sigma-70 factor (ECF subfamily)